MTYTVNLPHLSDVKYVLKACKLFVFLLLVPSILEIPTFVSIDRLGNMFQRLQGQLRIELFLQAGYD